MRVSADLPADAYHRVSFVEATAGRRRNAGCELIPGRELVVSTIEPVSEPIEQWTGIVSVANPIENEIAQGIPTVRPIAQENRASHDASPTGPG